MLCRTRASDSRLGLTRVEHPPLRIGGLLVEIRVMMVPMMVMVVYDHDNLSLRRIGHCKAEKENQSDPELLHALL